MEAKVRKCLVLACLLMAGVVFMSGCGAQDADSQAQSAGETVSATKKSEKKESEYAMSRVKYYDADGVCTTEVLREYDEKGKEVHRVQKDYGQVNRIDESFYTYPDALTRERTYIDAHSGKKSQVVTTAYDESGNIQTETTTDYQEDGSASIMNRTEYTYDKQGNLVLKENDSTATVGKKLSRLSTTEYTYDKDNHCLTEKQVFSLEGQDGRILKDIEYQYDSKGNQIKEVNHIADEFTSSPIVYEYNQKGQLIKESDYQSTAPDTLKQYFVYEYDENGNRSKYNQYSADDQLLSYAEYEYIMIGEP